MNTRLKGLIFSAGALLMASQAAPGAQIDLFEWVLRIDGDLYDASTGLPGGVNASGFDFGSGLGALSTTVNGAGSHFVGWFLDHEIDEPINLWFNETGGIGGTPAAGQSWEIDEPGYGEGGGQGPYLGDIYDNLDLSDATGSLLDGLIFENLNPAASISGPDDVSMALGWNFLLDAGQIATFTLMVGQTAPAAGFYLIQTDPDSDASVYMYGGLDVREAPVPAPATLLLVSAGLLGIGGLARKQGPRPSLEVA